MFSTLMPKKMRMSVNAEISNQSTVARGIGGDDRCLRNMIVCVLDVESRKGSQKHLSLLFLCFLSLHVTPRANFTFIVNVCIQSSTSMDHHPPQRPFGRMRSYNLALVPDAKDNIDPDNLMLSQSVP